MKIKVLYYTLLFGFGFYGYGLLEIIWRGRTHPSMSLAGGIIFCIMSYTQSRIKNLNLLYRCIVGGIIITIIELLFGLIVNIKLNQHVWDYSMFPINYEGQVCLLYSVMWCFLTAPIIFLSDIIKVETKKNMSH